MADTSFAKSLLQAMPAEHVKSAVQKSSSVSSDKAYCLQQLFEFDTSLQIVVKAAKPDMKADRRMHHAALEGSGACDASPSGCMLIQYSAQRTQPISDSASKPARNCGSN